jgi:hypothetical protein
MKQKQNETEHLLSTEANRYRLLEDAAERLYPDCNNVLRQMAKETFINGAKWQQERSYSEEEVEDLIYNVCGTVARLQGITLNGNHIDTAYKHFKKKITL